MSILKELNELAAKYSEDYEKKATIEGAIDAVDKSLEGALGALEGGIEDLQDLTYGDGGTAADPAEGSILARIDALEENSGILVVGITEVEQTMVLDKTWQEIHDAPYAVLVFEQSQGGGGEEAAVTHKVYAPVIAVTASSGVYTVEFGIGNTATTFLTTETDGYPAEGENPNKE